LLEDQIACFLTETGEFADKYDKEAMSTEVNHRECMKEDPQAFYFWVTIMALQRYS